MFLPYASLEETKKIIEQSVEYWRSDTPAYLHFAILLGEKHIGEISLYTTEDPKKAELGWVIHRDYWGQGIVTEAAFAMLDFAKSKNYKSVIACCDFENTGSYRVMEKIGMKKVSCTFGRKNRSSDEERYELLYEILI